MFEMTILERGYMGRFKMKLPWPNQQINISE